jgi:hypothetical protein
VDATLDDLRADFRRTSSIEMPVAGILIWSLLGLASLRLTPGALATATLYASGAIFPLALLIGRLRGRNLLAGGTSNPLTTMFLQNLALVVLLWIMLIATHRAGQDPLALVLGGGVIMGLIWISFGWAVGTLTGLFHAIGRTLLCIAAYTLVPAPWTGGAICAAVILAYLLTLPVLIRDLAR